MTEDQLLQEIANGEAMMEILKSRIEAKLEKGLYVSPEEVKLAKIEHITSMLKAEVSTNGASTSALIIAYALMEKLVD